MNANETLGPHYTISREFAERIMSGDHESGLAEIIDKAAKDFRDKLTDSVQWSVMNDAECNVQGEIWREVDDIVTAILGGEQWALQRHVLGDRYDCEKIRETIARMIPDELYARRIAEMEKRIGQLDADVRWYRERC